MSDDAPPSGQSPHDPSRLREQIASWGLAFPDPCLPGIAENLALLQEHSRRLIAAVADLADD